jgi:hypothetical protein
LEELRQEGARGEEDILDVLADIARQVDASRCRRPKDTGFHKFAEDLRREFATAATQCGEDCRCGDACAPSGDA